MGKFEIKQRANGEYQFNLKAGNGEIILTSEGYTSKSSCKNGIDSVRNNSIDDSRYNRLKSSNNKDYFNLKARNGEIIGTSEMYESTTGMENGIQSVKNNAPDASEVDLT